MSIDHQRESSLPSQEHSSPLEKEFLPEAGEELLAELVGESLETAEFAENTLETAFGDATSSVEDIANRYNNEENTEAHTKAVTEIGVLEKRTKQLMRNRLSKLVHTVSLLTFIGGAACSPKESTGESHEPQVAQKQEKVTPPPEVKQHLPRPEKVTLSPEQREQEKHDLAIAKKKLEKKFKLFDEKDFSKLLEYGKNETALLEIRTSDGGEHYTFFLDEGSQGITSLEKSEQAFKLIPKDTHITINHWHTHPANDYLTFDLPVNIQQKIKTGELHDRPHGFSDGDFAALLKNSVELQKTHPNAKFEMSVHDQNGGWTYSFKPDAYLLQIYPDVQNSQNQLKKMTTSAEARAADIVSGQIEADMGTIKMTREGSAWKSYMKKLDSVRTPQMREYGHFLVEGIFLSSPMEREWKEEEYQIGPKTLEEIETYKDKFDSDFSVIVQFQPSN